MKNALFVTALLLLAASSEPHGSANANAVSKPSTSENVTIDFDNVTNGVLTDYHEHGFLVRSREPGSWMGDYNYGDPAPFIEFTTPAETKSTKSVLIKRGAGSFSFQSVDIYSSITPIPYQFRGILNGMTLYVVTGTVPNTFGNFATVTNPKAKTVIDRLIISVTNPSTCCTNPVGIDTIVLKPVAASAGGKTN
jgi:hypothetical protein